MNEENKNKKQKEIEVLERLILRSPLLDFAKKTELLDSLKDKNEKQLQRMALCFQHSEKDLFQYLAKAGLDAGDFEHKLGSYLNRKLEKVERKEQGDALSSIEKQIENL